MPHAGGRLRMEDHADSNSTCDDECSKSQQFAASLISLLSGIYAILLVIIAFTFEVSVVSHKDSAAGRYEAYYIYLYTLSLVFFGFCFTFLLRSRDESNRKLRGRLLERLNVFTKKHSWLKKLEPSMDRLIGTHCTQYQPPTRLDRELMSLKRKVTHSSPSAGSMYLRLGAIETIFSWDMWRVWRLNGDAVFGVMGIIHYCLEIGRYIEIKGSEMDHCFSSTAVASLTLSVLFVFIQVYFIFLNSQLTIHRFKTIGKFGTMHLVATNLCVWIRSVVIEEHNTAETLSPLQTNSSRIEAATVDHHERVKRAVSLHLSRCLQETHSGTGFNLAPFLITCLIEYSIICAAVMFILWKNVGFQPQKRNKQRRQHFRVDCSSAARGFFLGILFFIAVIVTLLTLFYNRDHGHNPPSKALTEWKLQIYLSVEIVLFLIIIAATVIAGVCFQQLRESKRTKEPASLLLDDILLIVALVGELVFCMFRLIALLSVQSDPKQPALTFLRMIQVVLQTVLIMVGQRLEAGNSYSQDKKPGRNVVTFLLIANIALWASNMFEAQKTKTSENVLEYYHRSSPYAFTSTLPLTIFYRFHSSACLYEIWKNAYKSKTDFI